LHFPINKQLSRAKKALLCRHVKPWQAHCDIVQKAQIDRTMNYEIAKISILAL